jgi:hypothetical protein
MNESLRIQKRIALCARAFRASGVTDKGTYRRELAELVELEFGNFGSLSLLKAAADARETKARRRKRA